MRRPPDRRVAAAPASGGASSPSSTTSPRKASQPTAAPTTISAGWTAGTGIASTATAARAARASRGASGVSRRAIASTAWATTATAAALSPATAPATGPSDGIAAPATTTPSRAIRAALGSVKPTHAAIAPGQPARSRPIATESWLLPGPGRAWHSATSSAKAFSSSQPSRTTNAVRWYPRCATGPPNEVSPSRSETSRTSSHAGRRRMVGRAGVAGQAVRGSGASGSSPSSRMRGGRRLGLVAAAPGEARRGPRRRCWPGRSRSAPGAPRGCRSARSRRCPSTMYGCGTHGATRSGSVLIQSVATITGASSWPSTWVTYGTRGFWSGWSRFQRSTCERLVAQLLERRRASRPRRRSRTARPGGPRAASTCCRIEPEPDEPDPALRDPAGPGRPGEPVEALDDPLVDALGLRRLGVVLVVDRDVVEDVLAVVVHAGDAVAHDRRQLVRERRVVGADHGHGRRQDLGVAVVVLEALAGERRPPGRRAHQEPAPALVAERPGLVAGPLEPEHRVEDVERDHRLAVRRVGRRRRPGTRPSSPPR